YAHGGARTVVQLDPTLPGDHDRRGELDERGIARPRWKRGRRGPFLQAVVIEAERGRSATDPVSLRQTDSECPEGLRNALAACPLLTPGLKPRSPVPQIRRQQPTTIRAHCDPPR